jgi:hypothetical protein
MNIICGQSKIDSYFNQVAEEQKIEINNMLNKASSMNIDLSHCFESVETWTGKILNQKIKVNFIVNPESVKKITKTASSEDKSVDYIMQIIFLKENKSIILGRTFRGDEEKDWIGRYVPLTTLGKICVGLILDAAEGNIPFYFSDSLGKEVAGTKGLINVFTAIN